MELEQLKVSISKQIEGIERSGFAYLGPVLREALFANGTEEFGVIDWKTVRETFLKHNPEYK